ncbi:cyclase family protein [Mycolicibacter sinensis]
MATDRHHDTAEADLAVLQRYIDACSNWGRWGPEDQLGTLNLVGPDEVRAAAALVRSGRVISLTMPYDGNGPQTGQHGRFNPQLYASATGLDHLAGTQTALLNTLGTPQGFGFADDVVLMPTQSGTQWDALCHIFWNGRMWNGRTAAEVGSAGAAANGIQHYTGRLVMRGILIDMARARGVASLDPGVAITADDLDGYLESHALTVGRGDALLIRTGFMGARRGHWGDYAGGAAPGLSLHTAPWLHAHDVAAIATDTWGVEVRPNEIDVVQPLHVVSLVHGGMAFGEMFDLDDLAADCADDGVYEFMFVASPLPLTGATGSPVSALAIK